MKIVIIVFKSLITGKTKYATLVSVLFFVIGSIIPFLDLSFKDYDIEKLKAVSSSIFLGIGTSVLAASLVSTFEEVKINQLHKITNLLGLEHGKKVAVVIPRFPFVDTEEKSFGNEHGIAYADFLATKYIVGIFENFHLNLPTVITDEEACEIIKDKSKFNKYSTFISIGLFSNTFSELINSDDSNETKLFKFENRDKKNPNQRRIKIKDKNQSTGWQNLTPSQQECSDLAFFSKLLLNFKNANYKKKISVIICGGLNASGTSVIGELLYNSLENEIFPVKVRNIDDNSEKIEIYQCSGFAMVYKVTGKNNVRYDKNCLINPEALIKIGY